jgi:hypothetical protein
MSKYLMKYKGQYRIKPNLDLQFNDVPRDENGSIDPSYDDIYIKCASGSQIYHYGRSTLVAYIPSIGRGHNILIAIAKELNLIDDESKSRDYEALYSILNEDKTIFDIIENDEEIEFKFNAKNIELIAKYLKPQTSGADISPFSSKNLPKASYTIPVEDLEEYTKITNNIPQSDKLSIGHITKRFMNDILSKDKLYKTITIQTDMRKKCMRNKEYIHSMGYWNKYIKYLEKELCQN